MTDEQARQLKQLAENVAAYDWGTSVTESYHNRRVAAMERLREMLKKLNNPHVDCPCWITGTFQQVPCPIHDGKDRFPKGTYDKLIQWMKFVDGVL